MVRSDAKWPPECPPHAKHSLAHLVVLLVPQAFLLLFVQRTVSNAALPLIYELVAFSMGTNCSHLVAGSSSTTC
jgi:hypothetical protein